MTTKTLSAAARADYAALANYLAALEAALEAAYAEKSEAAARAAFDAAYAEKSEGQSK